jgi:hypothetical protein
MFGILNGFTRRNQQNRSKNGGETPYKVMIKELIHKKEKEWNIPEIL